MLKRKKKDKDKVKLTSNTWAQLRKFNKFFKPSRGLFILGWVFLVLSSITAVVFPTLMGQLVGQKEGQAPVIDACENTQVVETEDYTANIGTFGVEDFEINNSELIIQYSDGKFRIEI